MRSVILRFIIKSLSESPASADFLELRVKARCTAYAGPLRRRTDKADTHGWTSRPRAPGACSRSEPTAACPGTGLGSLESTHRWTEQHGPRHCTVWVRWTDPGWSRLKAEPTASRACTGRDQDVPLWESAVSDGHDPNPSELYTNPRHFF
jgi:hypothetical protein